MRRLLAAADLADYSRCSRRQDGLFKQLFDMVEEDDAFLERVEGSGVGRLAFANGVWDFRKRELLPFSPDIVLFHKLPHAFPVTPEEVAAADLVAREIRDRVIDPVWTRSAEYVMQNTARAAAGFFKDRLYHFGIGETASGKGVWMNLVESALTGKFTGSINSGNLLWQRRTGDHAKANSWMCAVRDKRIVFTSEIQTGPGIFIDGNKLKEVTSGGESVTGRQNNQDEITFRMQGCMWSFANDTPPIKPTDSAVKSRVRFVPMENTFLPREEFEARKHEQGVKLADETIKEFVSSHAVGAVFAWMLTSSFVDDKIPAPDHISVETAEWLEEQDFDALIKNVVAGGSDEDFVTNKDLLSAANESGMDISKTKLGHLMKRVFGISTVNRGGTVGRVYAGVKLVT